MIDDRIVKQAVHSKATDKDCIKCPMKTNECSRSKEVWLQVMLALRKQAGWTQTNASVMMVPEADHVNTSIWPGVSNTTYLTHTAVIIATAQSYSRHRCTGIFTCSTQCIYTFSVVPHFTVIHQRSRPWWWKPVLQTGGTAKIFYIGAQLQPTFCRKALKVSFKLYIRVSISIKRPPLSNFWHHQ